jgi:predicted RNA-binding Zn ribbon-like protein
LQQPVPFRFGGRACLDFVNTVSCRTRPVRREYLADYATLAAWAWQVELIGEEQAMQLQQRAAEAPRAARRAHCEAIELREALYRLFRAVMQGEPPHAHDMAGLNEHLSRARPLERLVPASGAFAWQWCSEPLPFGAPSLLAAISAAEFLTRDDLSRLRDCPGPDGCGWLFYDETRNRSRRWCSMDHCGGAAKTRRFRERARS